MATTYGDWRDDLTRDAEAAGYAVQFSAHGAGRHSIQVFTRDGKLIRDFDTDESEVTTWDEIGLPSLA